MGYAAVDQRQRRQRGYIRVCTFIYHTLERELRPDALDALPPHAKTASACLPLAEVGIAMWIAAPPGAGKSSTGVQAATIWLSGGGR